MAETIRQVEHYSASVANKVGEGARVLEALRSAGVNLIALWGYARDTGKATLEFIPENGGGPGVRLRKDAGAHAEPARASKPAASPKTAPRKARSRRS